MDFSVTDRPAESPLVDTIMHGRTLRTGSTLRPAETHWHMVFLRYQGGSRAILVGPLTSAGTVSFQEGGELLWVRFKLGTFMPHIPIHQLIDKETTLPNAAGKTFWLQGSAWDLPDFETVDVFLDRLAREEILACDPLIQQATQKPVVEMSPRTVRHRFQQATGQTQGHIHQFRRAQYAAGLLRQGVPILDTVHRAGYYDQPHLTRSLKKFTGYTPNQIAQQNQSA